MRLWVMKCMLLNSHPYFGFWAWGPEGVVTSPGPKRLRNDRTGLWQKHRLRNECQELGDLGPGITGDLNFPKLQREAS